MRDRLSARTQRELPADSPVRTRTSRSALQPHPAPEDVKAHRAVAVGAHDRRDRAAQRGHACPARDGRRCCGGRPRSRRSADAAGASSAGSPGSALPWWATFSASTRREVERPVTSDSASAVRSSENAPTSARATTARSFGSPAAAPCGGGGHRTRRRMPPSATTSPARGTTRARRRPPRGCGSARWTARRPAGPAVDHEPRSVAPRARASAAPSWSAWAWVSTSASSRLTPRLGSRARIGPSGRPGVHQHRGRRRAASASRRPGRCPGTRRRARPRAGGGRPAAARARPRRRPRPRARPRPAAAIRRGAAAARAPPRRPRAGRSRQRRRGHARAASAAAAASAPSGAAAAGDRGERQRGRGVRDPPDVDEQRRRQRGERRGQRRASTCAAAAASTPSHIIGAIAGRREQVRRQRGERDLVEVQRHQRRRAERRRER